jgi:catalase (peroxidase I)
MKTGLKDKNGVEISAGDKVSLAGNMTADNSFGILPNGWTFDEDDVYEVYFDERIKNWSLRLGVEPDSPYNRKYLNHAVSLLHGAAVAIISP